MNQTPTQKTDNILISATKICILIVVCYILAICDKEIRKTANVPEPTKIEVGEKYLMCFDWDEKDPFKEKNIDTTTVKDYKQGYVLFTVGDTVTRCKESVFLQIAKPLKK